MAGQFVATEKAKNQRHNNCPLKEPPKTTFWETITQPPNNFLARLYTVDVSPFSYPLPYMYGISTYMNHKNQTNVGKYASPMDGMGSPINGSSEIG